MTARSGPGMRIKEPRGLRGGAHIGDSLAAPRARAETTSPTPSARGETTSPAPGARRVTTTRGATARYGKCMLRAEHLGLGRPRPGRSGGCPGLTGRLRRLGVTPLSSPGTFSLSHIERFVISPRPRRPAMSLPLGHAELAPHFPSRAQAKDVYDDVSQTASMS